jgi:hypothetical protein
MNGASAILRLAMHPTGLGLAHRRRLNLRTSTLLLVPPAAGPVRALGRCLMAGLRCGFLAP